MDKFILTTIGITIIITEGWIFKPLRKRLIRFNKTLGKLFSCPLCLGWWVGLILYSVMYNRFGLENIYYAFSSSSVCYLFYCVLEFLNKER